jgi:pre-mRNA-splicing factor CDC5/CEF1
MRVILKGGVWKNTEDEVLKAAVMKYGLNMWPRCASLLPRKTAKQCKARWHEWLDPGIRKTEWTREEEERLLHLAKLMPAQWRSIAPLVGRTPAQCVEHYERLLDAAAVAAAGGGGGGGGASAAAAAPPRRADDPRRLRPGEIDPMPEIKPARPDPVDMDEDEKEMLSEARARLANTKGKKAKRKAREKVLDEARRLAVLQKLRELKAAGVDPSKKRERRKAEGINYATEVPFERRAPAGAFSTAGEDAALLAAEAAQTTDFKVRKLNEIEDERRRDVDARERAKDRATGRRLAATNLPAALLAEAEADPLAARKRPRLALPAPLLTVGELEDIAAVGRAAAAGGGAAGALEGVGGAVLLLGDGGGGADFDDDGSGSVAASVAAAAAAARAARGGGSGGGGNPSRGSLLEEARNAAALKNFRPVLEGGENIELEAGTGFAGALPEARRGAPPGTGARGVAGSEGATAVATPLTVARGGGGGGSVRGGGGGGGGGGGSVAGGAAPSVLAAAAAAAGGGRDVLGLNAGDDASTLGGGGDARSAAFGSVSAASARRSTAPSAVALSLASLPGPRNAWAAVVAAAPEGADGDGEGGGGMGLGWAGTSESVADAADAAERAAEKAEAARLADLARRSAALKMVPPPPRPLVIDDDAVAPPLGIAAAASGVPPEMRFAEGMIAEEVLALLKWDAFTYPVRSPPPHPHTHTHTHTAPTLAFPRSRLPPPPLPPLSSHPPFHVNAD